ncbi:Cof-type HAD-IIB family hydrolase [Mycoplasmopsis caviae]|uniref:Cof-like hydrolase n=1 Tax=Mycoplasmopsis caviae TaxID=55603 RepID=A0A3P8L7G9_9BACT|nr:HAD family hydrolase [Mycoplasmopsis caviae]UUD34981.1 Cof-type HAD-IIB family hydrolase [Mycoplasmopsis caviae]VDR42195.1 Cof-like hydrolase [Mycoplasmopsis caviae]
MSNEKLIKRVCFSDVDGTIYGFPNKELKQDVVDSVKDAEERYNLEFIIATGNPANEKIKKLAKTMGSRYIITAGGAGVYDMKKDEYIHLELIDKSEAKKIFDLSSKNPDFVHLYYFGKKQYYLYNASVEMEEFLTKFSEYDAWDKSGIINDDIHKIELFGTVEEVKKAYEKLKKLNLKLNVIFFGSHIEITPNNVDKGYGLRWICNNIFKCDPNYVMSIGDSENDVAMLEAAGYSYAMDNAKKVAKDAAKFYTSDVNQNGLGEAINDYIFRTHLLLEKQELKNKLDSQKKRGKY